MEQHHSRGESSRRLRRSADQIREILEAQEQSRLTIRAYCEANGISEKNFYRWTKKYRPNSAKRQRRNKPATVNGFARVEITPATATPSRPFLFAEIGHLRIYKEVPASYLKALLS